jgi:RNA polymerase sigma-70 factor (ECF subfamily)
MATLAAALTYTMMPNSRADRPDSSERAETRPQDMLEADLWLVSKCLAGDESAWEALVRSHTRRVYGLCYRFTNSDIAAQDLTQEVFIKVFRNLRSFRQDEGSFVVWLNRLARNLLIDHYRRTKPDRATSSIEEQLPMLETQSGGSRTDALLDQRETSQMLQEALQKLSPELREAVILRDLQELEYREIAQVLKVPEGTVKSRLNRGRAELARLVRKQGMPV